MNIIIKHNFIGTNNHGFGHVPDPSEPEEFECFGDCSLCKWAEVHKDGRYICNGDKFEEKEKREIKVLSIVTLYDYDRYILATSESEDALIEYLRREFVFQPSDENEDIEKAIAESHGWWKGWWKNEKIIFDYWEIETVAKV